MMAWTARVTALALASLLALSIADPAAAVTARVPAASSGQAGGASGGTATFDGGIADGRAPSDTSSVRVGAVECMPDGSSRARLDGVQAFERHRLCPDLARTQDDWITKDVVFCPSKVYVWRFYGTVADPAQATTLSSGDFPLLCPPVQSANRWRVYFGHPSDSPGSAQAPRNTVWNTQSSVQVRNLTPDGRVLHGTENCIAGSEGAVDLRYSSTPSRYPCEITAGAPVVRVGTSCENLQTGVAGADNSLGDWLASSDPVKVRQAKLALLYNYVDILEGRRSNARGPAVASQLGGLSATNYVPADVPQALVSEASGVLLTARSSGAVAGRTLDRVRLSAAGEAALRAWSPSLANDRPCASPVQFVDMLIKAGDPGQRLMGFCVAIVDTRGFLNSSSPSRPTVYSPVRPGSAGEGLWPTFSYNGPTITRDTATAFTGTMLDSKRIPVPIGGPRVPPLSEVGRLWSSVVSTAGSPDTVSLSRLRARYALGMRATLDRLYQGRVSTTAPDVDANGNVWSVPGERGMPRRPGLFGANTMPGAAPKTDAVTFQVLQDRTGYGSAGQTLDATALHLYRTAECFKATVSSGLAVLGSDPTPADVPDVPRPTPTPVSGAGPVDDIVQDNPGSPLPYDPTLPGTSEVQVSVYMPRGLYATGEYGGYQARVDGIRLLCGSRVCNHSGARDYLGGNLEPTLVSVTGQLQVRPVGATDAQFTPCVSNRATSGCAYRLDPSASSSSAALSGQRVNMVFYSSTPSDARVQAVVSGGRALVQRYRWENRADPYECNVRMVPAPKDALGRPTGPDRRVTDTCWNRYRVPVRDGAPVSVGMALVESPGSAPGLASRVFGSVGGSGG